VSTPPTTALELAGVSKRFGSTRALDGLDLTVRTGSVHAILGGNGSGKSTTLKILAGVYAADTGTIRLDGVQHSVDEYSPHVARNAGLRFVHQNLGLVGELSVCENFALEGGFPRRAGRIDWNRLRSETKGHLEAFGLDVDPRAPARSLRPSDQALVAIVRALRPAGAAQALETGTPTLVLDEPTACLPHQEASRLIAALHERRSLGQTIIYVSHRLPEVLGLADDITVLRDGIVAATGPVGQFDGASIIGALTGGRQRGDQGEGVVRGPAPVAGATPDEAGPLLEVRDLVAGPLHGVSLTLRPGEVLGVAGILGSGRTSLLRVLFGELPSAAGELVLDGEPFQPRRPAEAMARGVALVPEDRAGGAAFLDQSVTDNVHAGSITRYWRTWRIDRRAMRRDATSLMAEFRVRAASSSAALGSLSGGNQQKVILARWLRREPNLLLLDEPTQGIDVAARADVHEQVRAHASRGNGSIVISSDFAELVEVCDRVLVLRSGRIVAVVRGDELSEERLARLAHLDVLPDGDVAAEDAPPATVKNLETIA
jgi:ribose transport system ATP-binding protein